MERGEASTREIRREGTYLKKGKESDCHKRIGNILARKSTFLLENLCVDIQAITIVPDSDAGTLHEVGRSNDCRDAKEVSKVSL